jgi:uncharacterized membrane protein
VQLAVFRCAGGERLREALGNDYKGKLSPVLYVLGIFLCSVSTVVAVAVYTVVALVWLVPDRRLERYVVAHDVSS